MKNPSVLSQRGRERDYLPITEVASVPSQEVENGRRDYLLKTIIELSTILWQDGSCQGELGK